MQEDFDKAMDELQASIIEDARKVYSEKVIQIWLDPKYMGKMKSPQAQGKITGSCGDTMHIFLKIEKGKIRDARFFTDGCVTTVASGCMACELAMQRTCEEALAINNKTILNELGGLPEESTHCALLASDTLRAAINDYMQSRA